MENFHLFPRLPLELLAEIWRLATPDRILHVQRQIGDVDGRRGFWSPDSPPGVTRASRESRQYCGYRKAFIVNPSPRYIWANFDHDTIQMRAMILTHTYEPLEKDEIRHLRVEIIIDDRWVTDETEEWVFSTRGFPFAFPKLNRFCLVETESSVSKVVRVYTRAASRAASRAPSGPDSWQSYPVA